MLVTIRHEALASPEETIMKYLEDHPTIKNKTARTLTHVAADHQMKSIFGRMQEKGFFHLAQAAVLAISAR